VGSRSLKGVSPEDQLRLFYTGRHPELERFRKRFRFVPASPRCRVCYAPFGGVGGAFLRRRGYVRWPKNPNICQRCIVEFDHVGCRGAEVEMSMLFADVRGATELAGGMSASDFSNLMSRFFRVATTALLDAGALVDKFVGDEVVGLFVPGVAGDDHAGRAIEAAEALLRGVGFDDDPWVAVGVGVHTGIVYLGLVGDGEVSDFTAMGDNMNIASRLAGAAGAGEILVSESAALAAGVSHGGEHRTLTLKGVADRVAVDVIRVDKHHATG